MSDSLTNRSCCCERKVYLTCATWNKREEGRLTKCSTKLLQRKAQIYCHLPRFSRVIILFKLTCTVYNLPSNLSFTWLWFSQQRNDPAPQTGRQTALCLTSKPRYYKRRQRWQTHAARSAFTRSASAAAAATNSVRRTTGSRHFSIT